METKRLKQILKLINLELAFHQDRDVLRSLLIIKAELERIIENI